MNAFDDRIYSRITELLSLLNRGTEDMTVARIAQLTESTPEQTRLDLLQLHRCGFALTPEDIFAHPETFDSRCDHTPLSLDITLPGDPFTGSGLLFLDPIERSLYMQKGITDLRIKDTPTSVSASVMERVGVIEEAISRSCFIRFRYKRAGASAAETIETAPRFLYFNATDDLYYCISFHGEETVSFRLDRMLFSVHLTRQKAAPLSPDDSRLQRLQYVWGAAFSSDEPPCPVRLRIEAGTANILNKIRSDTVGRRHASLYQQGDDWIYEDAVIGLNAFRSWLLLFGSSVKVLEPPSLAEEVLASARSRLENYEAGGVFLS